MYVYLTSSIAVACLFQQSVKSSEALLEDSKSLNKSKFKIIGDGIFAEKNSSTEKLFSKPNTKRKINSSNHLSKESVGAFQNSLFSIGSQPSLDEFDLGTFTSLNKKTRIS